MTNKNLKRIDPDPMALPEAPIRDHQPDPGPTAKAKVARGRTLHLPTNTKKIVGSRPYEIAGVILHRDVTAQEFRTAGPGEIVELPVAEIERLIGLGFLQSLADQPAISDPRGPRPPRPETGVQNDPRLTGKPMNSLTTATTRG